MVTFKGIKGGFRVARKALEILLKKIIPKNKILCEPQMGKRGLYPNLSTKSKSKKNENPMDFLQYADGKNDLEIISKKIKINLRVAKKIYILLKKNNLVY